MRLDGKVALVTGGGRGIGKGISTVLASEGADVVVNYVSDRDSAQNTVNALRQMGRRAIAIGADVSDADNVDALAEQALAYMGKIDILVNNAGIQSQFRNVVESSVEAWDKVLSTNLRSAYLCCRRVGQWMVSQSYGRVVNVSSVLGSFGSPLRSDYCTAKAGMVNLTRQLAVEWARYNIRVNCISPGYVATDMVLSGPGTKGDDQQPPPIDMELAFKRIPMARMATAEEVGKVTAFLVSEDSSFITGANIPVDGGWSANALWNP